MKRNILLLVSLAVSLTFLTGMGMKQESKIPVPIKEFKATVIDRANVKTEGNNISVEGEVFLKSEHGKGVLYIEFKDVQKIIFLPPKQKKAPVDIYLKTGEKIRGVLNANLHLYGFAAFGKFKVRLRELKSVEFHEPPPDSQ